MKKRMLSLLMLFLIMSSAIFSGVTPTLANTSAIKVLVDGDPVTFDVPPQLINNRVMVPFRKIFEELGLAVSWDAKKQLVTGSNDQTKIQLVIGQNQAKVNGQTVNLDTAAQIKQNRTMVPVRFIAESTGLVVTWDQDAHAVYINTPDIAQKKLQTGQYVRFGEYNQAPILWKILKVDQQGNLLLQSDRIITFKAFNPIDDAQQTFEPIPNAWSTSALRQWLNSAETQVNYAKLAPAQQYLFGGYNAYADKPGFLKGFTETEQSLLMSYTHKVLLSEENLEFKDGGTILFDSSHKEPDLLANYDDFYYQKVTDKVFVPSVKLIDTLVRNKNNSAAKIPTPQAIAESDYQLNPSDIKTNVAQLAQDIIPTANSPWCYWTDTPDTAPQYRQTGAFMINSSGYIDTTTADNGVCGVSPVIQLKNSAKLVQGNGSLKYPFVFQGSSLNITSTDNKSAVNSASPVTVEVNTQALAKVPQVAVNQQPYPVKYHGKWGYINQNGEFVIQPQYNDAGKFNQGLAYVKVGDLYGYINTAGKMVIAPSYGYAADFSEGVALVSYSTTRTDFRGIDTSGKVLFYLDDYDDLLPAFHNGLLPVKKNGKFGFIDKKGKLVLPYKYDLVWGFKDGYCIAQNYGNSPDDDTYYLIDTTGQELLSKKEKDGRLDEYAEGFITGFRQYGVPAHMDIHGQAIIDESNLHDQVLPTVLSSGKYTAKVNFITFWPFEQGVSPFLIEMMPTEGGLGVQRWGFMDRHGQVIVPPIYGRVGYFRDGLALAAKFTIQKIDHTATKDGMLGGQTRYNSVQYVYLDAQGKEVIRLSDNVEAAGQFVGGLAPFKANGKFGFIDHTGKIVCQPIFDDVLFDNIL